MQFVWCMPDLMPWYYPSPSINTGIIIILAGEGGGGVCEGSESKTGRLTNGAALIFWWGRNASIKCIGLYRLWLTSQACQDALRFTDPYPNVVIAALYLSSWYELFHLLNNALQPHISDRQLIIRQPNSYTMMEQGDRGAFKKHIKKNAA